MKVQFLAVTALAMLFAASPANAETANDLKARTHIHGIAFARAGSAALLLATHHGMYAIAKDGTATALSEQRDYMGFSPDPSEPLTYYASGHPPGGGNLGLIVSRDGGASWSKVSDGLDGPVDFHQMTVSPANAKVIYGSYGGIQVSSDGGKTWTMAGPAPEGLIALSASATEPATLFAATKAGLLVSKDGGASFSDFAFSGQAVSFVNAGTDGSLFAFAVGQGLMLGNEEEPKGFSLLSNSFGQSIPLHLAIDGQDSKHLALATHDGAVLESRDGGASWVPFGQAQ